MGLRSWFYGDIMQLRDARTDHLWLPALTLNVDDLRDCYAKLKEYSPQVSIQAYTSEAQIARFPADIEELLERGIVKTWCATSVGGCDM